MDDTPSPPLGGAVIHVIPANAKSLNVITALKERCCRTCFSPSLWQVCSPRLFYNKLYAATCLLNGVLNTKKEKKTEEEQSLKLDLRQSRVWNVSDFNCLASHVWEPVLSLTLSLTLSYLHWQISNFGPDRCLNPEPSNWPTSTITKKRPLTPFK